MLPKAFKSCPKSNKLPDLVTLTLMNKIKETVTKIYCFEIHTHFLSFLKLKTFVKAYSHWMQMAADSKVDGFTLINYKISYLCIGAQQNAHP